MNDREPLDRITVDPDVMVGKPVIVGTRIPVALILRLMGQGMRSDEILDEYPQLEAADIEAAAAYAAAVVDREDVLPTADGLSGDTPTAGSFCCGSRTNARRARSG